MCLRLLDPAIPRLADAWAFDLWTVRTIGATATSCYTLIVKQRRRWEFVYVVLFIAAFPGSAASGPPSMARPDSAKAIARLLEEHYHQAQTLRAVFLERYSEGPREARIESGTVYFRRPGRMRWDYESPEKKVFVADGKTVWFYVPADHTVTRVPMKESSDWRTPLALLTGKADLSRLCSRIELVNQSAVPAGHATLRCLPKGEKNGGSAAGPSSSKDSTELPSSGNFTEVFLEVDSSSGELARAEVRQAGGIELEYRFGDWQENLPLPDEMFRFRAPAGVAIVDGSALNGASH
jgi:outer membrane lipoprotein carrier protein